MGKSLTREEVMAIHALSDHKVPKRQIAKQMGIDESTVRYHLQRRDQEATDGRKGKPMKADQLEQVIDDWHEAQANSKRPGNVRDLYEFLQAERGYEGSYKSILRYCRKKYGKPKIRTYRRVETPPGAQVQIDWGEFPRVKLGMSGETWLSVFLMTLSHSRMPAVVWSEDKKMMSWLSCHNRSYEQLGGVAPVHRIDNVKTALASGAGPWGSIHPVYRAYARSMRFHIDACLPRQPQAKGKVEAKVKLIRRLMRLETRVYTDVAELQEATQERVRLWSQKTRCPATGLSVHESWRRETEKLQALPDRIPEPFDVSVMRSVRKDCMVSFEGRQYSVPFRYVGRMVEVRGTAEKVQILHADCVIHEFPRHTQQRLLIDPSCYEGQETDRALPPQRLGKMGRRLQEIVEAPVMQRPIDLYADLMEVAR